MAMSQDLSRRNVIKGGAALTLGVMLPRALWAQSAGKVSTTVFGGVWEQSYRAAIVDRFEAATGAKVDLQLGSSAEWLTSALLNQAAPEVDLLMLPYPDSIKAVMSGIGAELTAAEIPNLAHVNPRWYDQYQRRAVGLDYASYGIAYRTDLVKSPVTSWQDLFKPEFAQKIALPNIGTWGSWELLVMLARLKGGDEDNLQPAFTALRELKPNIRRFFTSSTDAMSLLDSGEVSAVGMITNIPAYALIDAGKPVGFSFPTEGANVGMVSYHLAKNAKYPDLCKQFINHAISKESQELLCNRLIAGPVRDDAVLTGKAAERVPALDHLTLFDWFKIVPQMSALTDQWNYEVAG
jgi:putative spermidine/putrescine transport system substrate-binding protein